MEWIEAGSSEHAVALLRAAHAKTWYSIQGLTRVFRCTIGAATGTPLANLMYVCSAACVLDSNDSKLEVEGLVSHLSAEGCRVGFGLGGDFGTEA